MGGLFGGGSKKNNNAETKPQYTGISIQTSAQGLSIPIIFGTARIAGNLIWYGNFQSISHTSTSDSGGGGKGGGGASSPENTTYTYATGLAFGLCEGEAVSALRIWRDKEIYLIGTSAFDAIIGTFYTGSLSQDADPWLLSYSPSEALSYRNTAYMINPALDLGESNNLPNISFEIKSLYSSDSDSGDANPANVIMEILTNSRYGADFPSSNLDTLQVFHDYCQATGLVISPALADQTAISQTIMEIISACNAAPRWSEGVLDIIPYGDKTITANGATYTAPSAPEYDLTDDDFIYQNDEAPVKLTRKRTADVYNSIKVEFLNRDNNYNTDIATYQDLSNVLLYGSRPKDPLTAHFFCLESAAMMSAQLLGQREKIRNTYEFTLGWKYIGLDPMDIVTITDSVLGLDRQWVRIKEITEDEDGNLSIIAEEYLNGTGNAPLYGKQATGGFIPNLNVDAGNINQPVFMEVPAVLSNNANANPEIWLALSGGDNWGGCEVWGSEDNTTYKKLGITYGKARTGKLTSALPSGNAIDTVNTLSITLNMDGQLLSGNQTDATNLNTLCWVDGELIAYATATLTGVRAYDLTYLVRGAYDTTISSHAFNSNFVRLDNAIFKQAYDPTLIDNYFYFKFVSFNPYGLGMQSLDAVQAYQYRILGSAVYTDLPNPDNLVVTYTNGFSQISWDAVADFRQPDIDYEIRKGSTWEGGEFKGRTKETSYAFLQDGTYFVSAHYTQPTSGSNIYSINPPSIVIAGGVLEQNIIADYSEAPDWAGTLSGNAAISDECLYLTGAGNILDITDYLSIPDILWYGGITGSGTYELPTEHIVNLSAPSACKVIMSSAFNAINIESDYLAITDLLNYSDILDWSDIGNITVQQQIALAQDDGIYGDWQNYITGIYNARHFKARVVLSSVSTSIYPKVSDINFSVDVPDLLQDDLNVAVSAGGTLITYNIPFNTAGAPMVSILDAQQGDMIILSSITATGFTVQILNGGIGVGRNISYFVKSY